tara:strand:+ start:4424 stop:4801 length:378 start_codon:yes stop_codon:yes gene_type:complete
MHKNNRPLSPHLTIYKPQITSLMSITHRITGIFQSIGLLVISIFLISLLFGSQIHNTLQIFLNHIVGKTFFIFYTFSLCYHLFNGIRHLAWDLGLGFNLNNVNYTGYATIILAFMLNFFIWLVVY